MPTFKTADGLTLFFSDEGDGLPVLALPGLTRNGSDFDYIAPHLSDVRLIRLDSRGRGKSDWGDPATYTIQHEAADALLLLDHLGIERVAILGTSRGGLIAMVLAATAKARLSGVCLVDIGPVIEPTGLEIIRGYIGKAPRTTSMEEAARTRAAALPDFVDVPESRWTEEAERAFRRAEDGTLALRYDPALAGVFNATDGQPAPDLWPLFDAFADLPLALIHGLNSNLLSQETVDEMARRRPDMVLASVVDRGHVPFLDEPPSIAAIRTWIGLLA